MPSNLEDWAQPDDSRGVPLDELLKSALSAQPSQPQSQANAPMGKMPAYIGTKVVCAIPMKEISFLTTIKGQTIEPNTREDAPGYLVVYEDGYKSWSPKDVFERSYRLITKAERQLI